MSKIRKMDIPEVPVPKNPVTIIILGAGNRGAAFAAFAKHYPEWLRVVAVADPRKFRHVIIAQELEYPIPEGFRFNDWTEVAKRPKFCDAVAICTPDSVHVGPAVAFADLKYNILLEKPMAPNLEDCLKIYRAIERNKVILAVCHVLRYTNYQKVLQNILESNVIGKIVNILHLEPVGFWHFAHSFVRGNWHKESESSFSLLAKSCHDLDIIAYMMQEKCTKISSFGSLNHFKKTNKPKEAGNAMRCLECKFETKCPYSAKKIYIEPFLNEGLKEWPIDVVQPNGEIDIENLTDALNKTNYGKCVYEMDNDVNDQQVVNMEFESGSTATFSMIAFTEEICMRKTRIFGTIGTLEGDGVNEIKHYDFLTRKSKLIKVDSIFNDTNTPSSGHFGGDFGIMREFVHACLTGKQEYIISGPKETFDSHMYVFAAEHARKTGTVVDIKKFKDSFCK